MNFMTKTGLYSLRAAVAAGAFVFCAASATAAYVTTYFDWTPGSAPSGEWFTSWKGGAGGNVQAVEGPDGSVINANVVTDSDKWAPYNVDAVAMDDYTFVTYGSVDQVAASSGKMAVLWDMGSLAGEKTLLVKSDDGHIRLVQANGDNAPSHSIDAGRVKGYHLFTVRFSKTDGASLQIDNGEPVADAGFTKISDKGLQIGSILSGTGTRYERGKGFTVLKMLAFKTSALPDTQYEGLCSEYPCIKCDAATTSAATGWVFPQDATRIENSILGGISIGGYGVKQNLLFGSTNAVAATVLAALPQGATGALAGLLDVCGSSEHGIYAYANGDGTFTIYHDDMSKTGSSESSGVIDATGLHVWTLGYSAAGGARLYCDGNLVAQDNGIKWTGSNYHTPSKSVVFANDCSGTRAIEGAKVYAVRTDFGSGDEIFDTAAAAADALLDSFECLGGFAGQPISSRLAALGTYDEIGSTSVEVTHDAVLRISEICPKPASRDPNGVEAGWIEIHNTSRNLASLGDYTLAAANRGGEIKAGAPLPDVLVPAGGYALVYTTKEYPKEGANDGSTPFITNGIVVAQLKINPKKFPIVRLLKGKTVVDSFTIPVDLPDNASFAPAGGIWGDYSGATVAAAGSGADDAEEIAVTESMMTISPNVVKNEAEGFYSFANVTGGMDGIVIDNSATAQMASKDMFSVSLMFRATQNTAESDSTGMPLFFCRNSNTSTPYSGILAFINKDPYKNIIVQIRDANKKNTRNYQVDSEIDWLDGKWHTLEVSCGQTADSRISVSVDGKIYIDTKCGVASRLNTSMPMCIGRAYDSSSWTAFTGELKDIRLYSGDAFPAEATDPAEATTDKTEIADAASVTRVILPTITPGRANNRTGEIAYGPNAGPLYNIKHKVSDWKAWAQAKAGEDYPVVLALNPIDDDAAHCIESVNLAYRTDFGEIAFVPMTKGGTSAEEGQLWTATIPGTAITQAGHILRWAAVATDAAGNKWRTPSFCDPDNAYEWYGTLIEPPADLLSEKLQTFHIFADATAQANMDKQYDSIAGSMPYGARVQIYDSQTGFYYDNVRIDLRGNTTAGFYKKSHGIRFIKSQPLTCTNPFTGELIDGLRKVSFIAEYSDPSFIRQALAFQLFKDMGLKVPYSYPVRLNMNGEFFQMAFHSNRFTDELIEDYYGLDPLGYSYKSVGTMRGSTTGGGTEKKTPDDGNDKDLSVLSAFYDTFAEADKVSESFTGDGMASEIPAVTKTVVKKFDLPAWINYLAATRITQECDDVWANLCAYYDVNGTGTWMPLGYDFNVSLGAIYLDDRNYTKRWPDTPTMANVDNFKSHPFYGGNRVRCHKYDSDTVINSGNRAFEAVWQSPKFRRLYLRRLRTVMDEQLKAPGTAKESTPFWNNYVAVYTNAIAADAALDREKWGYGNGTTIYWWPKAMTLEEGIADLWDNYVVPRREHLFVTHSVDNTSKAIGYGRDFNAGIPRSQSPTADLKDGFSVENTTDETKTAIDDTEKIVIKNANAEAVDMSGWRLAGRFNMTLSAGTVVDANDTITFVVDRKAYVAAHDAELTDQVIVGNAGLAANTTSQKLYTASDEEVLKVELPSDESRFLRFFGFDGVPVGDDVNEWIVLTNISDTITLDLEGINIVVGSSVEKAKCRITLGAGMLAPGASLKLEQETYSTTGWEKITNGELVLQIIDAKGMVGHSGSGVVQKNFEGYKSANKYLQLKQFDSTFTGADLTIVDYVVPGEDSALDAATLDEAIAAIENCEIVLGQDDIDAGLTSKPLVLTVVKTGDGYAARVDVKPEYRPVEDASAAKPVEVESGESGTVFGVSISNAVQGLWYGYEVSDTLGGGAAFANDVESFKRATGKSHTVKGSPRKKPSGFYRVKVLPAKPK